MPAASNLGAYYFHQDTDAFINIINVQGGPPVATGWPDRADLAGKPARTTALFQAAQRSMPLPCLQTARST
jgi:hypothetical protein